ncbi:Tagatose-6-phosphate kinase [Sebaldella termitidis]|uniref:1-phosphofructokinase n=1 Tax=Sebaldella termitidis (strain ATCC 33386 / NCTC 11300) TaxID=526218 RepID=D1AQG1_SEBTE|nr:1-phosphofructokinase [Sebaldella termitidis]ACZ10221.1 1-phosphofructokinase [Sebaldella termitidis ATCC 33386]SUI25560.1 Tagatose-6-phosphate kinase [Sebaldella termitidis]
MITTVTLNPAIDTRYFIEDFKEGRLFRAEKTIKSPGGKGLNVTKVLRQMGADVVATGIIGGKNGEWIQENLKKMDIKEEFYVSSAETRVCIAVLAKHSETEILESGEELTDSDLRAFEKKLMELVEKSDVITMSGSLPKGMDAGYYQKLVELVNRKGKKVILDTSGKSLLEGVKGKPYLIKPNFDELEYVLGESIDGRDKIKKAVEKLKNLGAQNVLVSLGGEGAIYFGEEILKITIPKIKIHNTVGSGDSSVAGFAKGLDDGLELNEILKLSMACGMSNAQSMETGRVIPEDVKEFMGNITVEVLKI